MVNEKYLEETERKFGPITKRNVIYRGLNVSLDNGIVYQNVEQYLKDFTLHFSELHYNVT